MGGAMLSKSLIQFSVDCVPSLLFDLRWNYGGGNEDNGDLLQKVPCTHCYTQCPQPCSGPLPAGWITTNWKILQEMGIPDHLTCFIRNLYAGQEATVRTRHGKTDWFQIGKGVLKAECCHHAYLTYMQSTS